MRSRVKSRLFFLPAGVLTALAMLGITASFRSAISRPPSSNPGWGVDACLSGHVPSVEVPGYLRMLKRDSAIQWLRERDIGGKAGGWKSRDRENGGRLSGFQNSGISEFGRAAVWRAERRAGFRVVAFASTRSPVPVEQEGNQLPEDLLAVYRAHAETAQATRGMVDAWEMVGEPETFYCKDLPDRVAAYQKAVYFGLKANSEKLKGRDTEIISASPHFGISEFPAVLGGALAFPPGPWLEVAAANGWFDYTDAINVHHYGFAPDLGAVIAAHRAFAARWTTRALPVWVTEAGLNNIPKDDWRNAAARAEQADYLIECARQAMAARVAVFMPFVLVHRGDPFAMTESARDRHPAWERYAAFTRAHRLPDAGSRTTPPPRPNPIVLQWLPDNASCTPSKQTRSYWFDEDEIDGGWLPIEGEVRIYNFGTTRARVRLQRIGTSRRVGLEWKNGEPDALEIAPRSRASLPVELRTPGEGYLREPLQFVAETLTADGTVAARSPLFFVVETPADGKQPQRAVPLALAPIRGAFANVGGPAPFRVTGTGGPWTGINGVTVLPAEGAAFRFEVREDNPAAVTPPMAIAALPRGLPGLEDGFLRLRVRNGWGQRAFVRVDLVTTEGERFSIVENLGRNWTRDSGDTLYLGYADFHPWVFGRARPWTHFDPAAVREMQLRFFPSGGGEFSVEIEAVEFLPGAGNKGGSRP